MIASPGAAVIAPHKPKRRWLVLGDGAEDQFHCRENAPSLILSTSSVEPVKNENVSARFSEFAEKLDVPLQRLVAADVDVAPVRNSTEPDLVVRVTREQIIVQEHLPAGSLKDAAKVTASGIPVDEDWRSRSIRHGSVHPCTLLRLRSR